MTESLYDLRWRRVRIRLRNTRNKFAREYPLFIFRAVLNCAAGLPGSPGKDSFSFYPQVHPLPNTMRKGRMYDLDLIFPNVAANAIEQFSENLRGHLADPVHNFEALSISAPETRSLACLESEARERLDLESPEVCLDFITPFSFPVAESKRALLPSMRWRLTTATFLDFLGDRLNAILPDCPIVWPEGARDIRLLPYFWDYKKFGHRSKSAADGKKAIQLAAGMEGPLYLRGSWQSLLPALFLCSELQLGRHRQLGQGRYLLGTNREFFDRKFRAPASYAQAWDEICANSDRADEFTHALRDKQEAVEQIAHEIRTGAWSSGAPRSIPIPKRDSNRERTIALYEPRDMLVQKAAHNIFGATFDRMFEDASIGYRPGRSTATARRMIASAYREGYIYVFESDIESFFDEIDWEIMTEAIDQCLPLSDRLSREILKSCIQCPVFMDEKMTQRSRGLVQGSVLSPLLANLYLDRFDEEVAAMGFRMIRYGDDFVIMARSEEEARRAHDAATRILQRLKLSLHSEKTSIGAVDYGFRFLGMTLDQQMDEEFIEKTTLKKTVFIRNQYAFAGIDADSLVVRKGQEIIAQVPLYRVGEIVIMGSNSLSARLVQQCSSRRIPISFCTASGWYINTLRPDSRAHFNMLGAHIQRRELLLEQQALEIALQIVQAKLVNYLAWLRELPSSASATGAATRVDSLRLSLKTARDLNALRGIEGSAARILFPFVNGLALHEGFTSKERSPRKKPDPWNVLLDFGYSLLFSRLNVLVRGQGMNPYLGFLHSPADNYESLVCDLQEPFRARIDRMIVKTVNRNVLTLTDFEMRENGKWSLKREAVGRFLETFERELEIRYANDPGTLRQLLIGQVMSLKAWIQGANHLMLYSAGPKKQNECRAGSAQVTPEEAILDSTPVYRDGSQAGQDNLKTLYSQAANGV